MASAFKIKCPTLITSLQFWYSENKKIVLLDVLNQNQIILHENIHDQGAVSIIAILILDFERYITT